MDRKDFIMKKCVDLIKSFDPITHSIDSHCSEQIGETNEKTAKPENVFIYQVIYGWYRERAVIEGFISSFYKDNSHCISRSDRIIYTVLAYLAIFRLDELGFHRFKEFAMTQNPTKVFFFASYLFNKTNLWGCLRAEWMKVRDLSFVENEIIAGIEQYIPELSKFCDELNKQAQDIADIEAAKDAARKAGTMGVVEATKKGLTIPLSPKLTRPRLHQIPEPERIDQAVIANPIPQNLNSTSLSDLEQRRQRRIDAERARVRGKYHPEDVPKLNSTISGPKIQDMRKEKEEREEADLDFERKYFRPPPDFSKIPASVRVNSSAILREDALFRKQQQKDANLLKKYEEELRDTSDFYQWQGEMRSQDHQQRLGRVALRREMAKQSAEEARTAMQKQKEDNQFVGDLLREHGDAIKQKKHLEEQLQLLRNQEIAKAVQEERNTKPKEAAEKVAKERKELAQQMSEEMEEKLRMKAEEERTEEEQKADRIRQLRAMNTVHRPFVKTFDPTNHAGVGLLDEMSFAEMKERMQQERNRDEDLESQRRSDILEEKQKKAKEIEARTASILRARQVKAAANRERAQRRKEAQEREEEEKEQARQRAARLLDSELTQKREMKSEERQALQAEEERVRRQQQYLGAAMGAVEETREQQQQLAKDRQAISKQRETREEALKVMHAKLQDQRNRELLALRAQSAHDAEMSHREDVFSEEKRRSIQMFKEKALINKQLFRMGRQQHEITRSVSQQHNPYAARISEESINTVRLSRSRGGTKSEKLVRTFQSAAQQIITTT